MKKETSTPKPSERSLQIERQYTYHAPKPGQNDRYVQLRTVGKEIACLLDEYRRLLLLITPISHEQSVVMNMIEECHIKIRSIVMWSNAAIACNEEEREEDHGRKSDII